MIEQPAGEAQRPEPRAPEPRAPEPPPPRPSLRAGWRMLGFAWAADRRLTIWAVALLSAEAVAASLFSLWLRLFIGGMTGHDRTLTLLAGLAVALSIVAAPATDYAGNRVQMALGDRTQYLLNRRLLELVGGSPTLTIHQTPAHLRQIELLQDESWTFSQVVPSLVQAVIGVLRIGLAAVLLASVSPLLLLLPAFGVPILALSRRSSDLFNMGNDLAAEPARRAEMLYNLAASQAAAAELRLFRLRPELLRRFRAEHRAIRDIHVRLAWRGQAYRLAGRAVFLAGYVGAIALVVHLAAAHQLSLGAVAMTAVLAGQVLTLVTGSAEHAQWLLRTLTSAARFTYLEQVAELPRANAATPAAAVPARLTAGIQLEAVSYRYPGQDRPVLTDINVLLPAGATVAIVGDNGAGKTTLVGLLAGLARPAGGRILVDGTDLSCFDPLAWRERISAGFQDHARFEFTVQQAVGIGRLAGLDDAAAAQAALDLAGAAELPGQLPSGLSTQLGTAWPAGIDLSGGQWQKVAIGRAMMRADPLLLLLDEPTAAIDAETEHRLFARWTQAAAGLRRRAGAITVLVSHRFGTVRMADLILVLSAGRICEQGSHQELMAAGGVYAELFELQARAYR
ncbi:MAG TPA: ABC transporter ATP-binding protein [Streptosporangiaceae bacterium]